ncbi:hypothetical protein GCM10027298_15270 [Epidermidibacterium keratini]
MAPIVAPVVTFLSVAADRRSSGAEVCWDMVTSLAGEGADLSECTAPAYPREDDRRVKSFRRGPK